jgi:hypothetical protein
MVLSPFILNAPAAVLGGVLVLKTASPGGVENYITLT